MGDVVTGKLDVREAAATLPGEIDNLRDEVTSEVDEDDVHTERNDDGVSDSDFTEEFEA